MLNQIESNMSKSIAMAQGNIPDLSVLEMSVPPPHSAQNPPSFFQAELTLHDKVTASVGLRDIMDAVEGS